MKTKGFEVKKLLNDKKFWFATYLITWAAALQGHMVWLKRQDSFKQKFGTNLDQNINNQEKMTENQQSTDATVIYEDS